MTESTSEYKKRIEEIKQSVENEPYMAKMREDIAEGISKTGIRQATVEEQFQSVLDETTGKDVISAPEIIVGRGGYATLGERLDSEKAEVSAQLADNVKQIEDVTKNPNNYKGAIVTIVDDDLRSDVKSVWQPVLDATGAKITFACITGSVGTAGYMTLDEIKGLQVQGHEIVSHTVNHVVTSDVTVGQVETDYPQSQQWLKDNGFKGYDTLVYPGGMHTNRVELKNVARKYYKYAVATNHLTDMYNLPPVDSWRVPRIQGDTSTLAQLKKAVDDAVLEGGWVILMTHSHVLMEAGSQKMRDFIEYVQGLNVPIMPFGEAAKYKGNAVAIGEFEKDGTFIGMDGAGKLGGSLIVRTDSRKNMDDLISTYKKNARTIVNLSVNTDTFLSAGGVMEVYRAYHDSLSFATYTPLNENKTYRRTCNYASGEWNEWVDLAKHTYETGSWTPVLKGSTTAGAHTYVVQEGRWTKIANQVIATFYIRITDAGLDSNMAGSLQIHGLPEASANTFALPTSHIQYNNITLPTNYTTIYAKPRISSNFVDFFINGNGVSENYLNKNHLTTGQAVVFSGQITYQVP